MSRTSLNKRMLAIKAEVLRRDPLMARLHGLTVAERAAYDLWRAQCDRIIDDAEAADGAGGAFGRLISGALWLPKLRKDIAAKIFPAKPTIPNDATLSDLAEAYKEMCK